MGKHHRCKLRNANIHETNPLSLVGEQIYLMTKLNLKAYLQNDRQILKPSHLQIEAFATTFDQLVVWFCLITSHVEKITQTIDKETNIYKSETFSKTHILLSFGSIFFLPFEITSFNCITDLSILSLKSKLSAGTS